VFYQCWQEIYDRWKTDIPDITFLDKLPTEEFLTTLPGKHHLLIIDDALLAFVNDQQTILRLFTQISHHENINLVLVTQNLFDRSCSANISLNRNANYLILMRALKDRTPARIVFSKAFPDVRQSRALVRLFDEVTADKPYTYLCLSFAQNTPHHLRICTNIFGENDRPISFFVYSPAQESIKDNKNQLTEKQTNTVVDIPITWAYASDPPKVV
jgi:hypothetical protein